MIAIYVDANRRSCVWTVSWYSAELACVFKHNGAAMSVYVNLFTAICGRQTAWVQNTEGAALWEKKVEGRVAADYAVISVSYGGEGEGSPSLSRACSRSRNWELVSSRRHCYELLLASKDNELGSEADGPWSVESYLGTVNSSMGLPSAFPKLFSSGDHFY
jgi:hypothetical protein